MSLVATVAILNIGVLSSRIQNIELIAMPDIASREAPPFPNDIPVYPLPRLSYAKLRNRDPAESFALFAASVEHGVFNLDFTDDAEGEQILRGVENAFGIGESFFSLPLEEKTAWKLGAGNTGY